MTYILLSNFHIWPLSSPSSSTATNDQGPPLPLLQRKLVLLNCNIHVGLESSYTATKYWGPLLQLLHRTRVLFNCTTGPSLRLHCNKGPGSSSSTTTKDIGPTQLQHMIRVLLNCNIVLFNCNIGPGSSSST